MLIVEYWLIGVIKREFVCFPQFTCTACTLIALIALIGK